MAGVSTHPSGLTRKQRRRLARARNTGHAVTFGPLTPGAHGRSADLVPMVGVTRKTVAEWCRTKEIQAVLFAGQWWVDLASLERHLIRRAATKR